MNKEGVSPMKKIKKERARGKLSMRRVIDRQVVRKAPWKRCLIRTELTRKGVSSMKRTFQAERTANEKTMSHFICLRKCKRPV